MTCFRRGRYDPGREERFEVVATGDTLEISLAGTADGERVEHRRRLAVPSADKGPGEYRPFCFLEPRALTVDRITIQPAGGGPELRTDKGVLRVSGAKEQYVMTIYPSDPHAKDVDLLPVAGQVEVGEMMSEGRAWSFLLTVVDDPWLTQLVRLYYDVKVPGQVLRGEVYLSIRPSNAKSWAIAATAGAAMTIKGVTGLVPALVSAGGLALLQSHWSDLLLVLSIPLIRACLAAVNLGVQWIRDS
jgi:hypothetical protein